MVDIPGLLLILRIALNPITYPKLFLPTVLLIVPLLSGCGDVKCWPICGSSSSGVTAEVVEEVVEVVIEDCSGLMNCNGTYSSASNADAKWTGACIVSKVTEADGYVKVHFNAPSANCGFADVRATGDVGSKRKLYTYNYDVNDREYMVNYLGTDVFDLLCLEGGVVSECAGD